MSRIPERPPLPTSTELVHKYNAGEKIYDLARYYHIRGTTVRALLIRGGVQVSNHHRQPKITDAVLRSCITQNKQGVPMGLLAKQVGLSASGLSSYMHTRGHQPPPRGGKEAIPLETRFWGYVKKTPGCWIWQGYIGLHGYGVIGSGSKKGPLLLAHRVSLQLAGVELPPKMRVDHKCMNRSCVKPKHLRVVSGRINAIENSNSASAINYRKTHCIRGHELNKKNTYVYYSKAGHPQRMCRPCKYYRRSIATTIAAQPVVIQRGTAR